MKKSFFYAGALVLALGIGYFGTKTVKASNMGPYTGTVKDQLDKLFPIKIKQERLGELELRIDGETTLTGCDCTVEKGKTCYCVISVN
ncbi:MAG: hypothetical protein ACEPOV_10975 [Hyphomicrobiales bacterium]